MRAGLRLAMVSLAAGLLLGSAPALAQAAQQPPANPPPSDTIGPRELQNFSISGTVTQPAQGPVATRPAKRPARTATPPSTADVAASVSEPAPSPQPARSVPVKAAPVRVATAEPRAQSGPAKPVTFNLPPADTAPVQSAPQPAPPPALAESDSAPENLAPAHGPSIFPWLLAALVIGAAAAFLLWRNRSREAYAGAARFDAFSPTPAPAPPVRTPPPAAPRAAPRAATPRPAPANPTGVVSTRLRPWIDLSFVPLRCVVEDERVTFEFDLDMYNSGSRPARDVLVEASMFNAGESQDQEIGAFFANPVAQGERIPEILPLKHVAVRTAVVAERSQMRVFEAAGRQVFVPLIAFNALYRWSDSESQTSAAYLLGRNTSGEKMAPFRADLGPRVFPGVGARALHIGVRN
jgi:hypothetical protein